MSVDINSVRNTVLAVCNKNNYGYISPSDFNLYAKQAQLDIFSEYIKLYNYYINMQNNRTAGSEMADLAEKAREDMEIFMDGEETLVFDSVYGVYSIFTPPTDVYDITLLTYTGGAKNAEIVKGSRIDISRLTNSNLTSPTAEYPMFVTGEPNLTTGTRGIAIVPNTIVSDVDLIYMRYPTDPDWAYVTLTSGEPVFNLLTSTDFELSKEEEPRLVQKILEFAGISIREPEVYKNADANDNAIQQ